MKGDKNKLSWIYRKKIKSQKSKNSTRNVDADAEKNKRPRIIVRNLPFKANSNDVKKFYEVFGQIEDINFPKRADNTPVGCCFVEFKRLEDASKAIFNTNKKEFLGRVISCSWALAKSKYCEKLNKESVGNENDESYQDRDETENVELVEGTSKQEEDPSMKEELAKRKKEERKLHKENQRKKRARLILRNLPFEVTEEILREHFSQYGTIEEVTILKKEDGQTVGCAFLQFERVQSAAQAIHYANLQTLIDRPVIVDWALPKCKFEQNNDSDKIDIDGVRVKVEKESDAEDASETEIKLEPDEESAGEIVEQTDIVTEMQDSDDDSVNKTGAEDGSEEDIDEEVEEEEAKEVKRPRFESHDVSEGRTIFLKNVPFSVKNEQLKKFMEQFGPVYYALVCMDPLTEYSKGTAFVKFKNVEDADKCLTAGNKLEMDDQIIEAQKALNRNEIENRANAKKQKHKDSRNLYLVKEGVVLAGSPAAAGVSAADMAKRLQLEQWKSQILRNLNMFVSRIRIIVHNLPATFDDAKLRKMIERHSPPNAVIKETRIMRDLRNLDMNGVGRSKEYGFVTFATHEDALQTLRNINNNPNIFTPNKRPIVSFSIENRIKVNAKQKRMQKSRENNPLWSGNTAKSKEGENSEQTVPAKKPKLDDSEKKSYTGIVAKPGENKLRNKFKLQTQAMIHKQTVKKEKKMKKTTKKLEEMRKRRNETKNEVKVKPRTKVESDETNLNKIVNRYKDKLKHLDIKKSKWYEQ